MVFFFEWDLVSCAFKNGQQKDVFKQDWIMFFKYYNHTRFNSEHKFFFGGGGGLKWISNKLFIQALKIMRQMDTCMIWLC